MYAFRNAVFSPFQPSFQQFTGGIPEKTAVWRLFGGENEQIRRLRQEGVEVSDDGFVDLQKYRWNFGNIWLS